VLTVGSMYPPHHLGGYELIWREAVERLRRNGHDVMVLTSDFARPGSGEEEAGVRRDLRLYWRDHEWPRFGLRQRLGLERHNAAAFDRAVRDHRPDAVLWSAMGGMSLSLLARARRLRIPGAAMVCDEWLLYGPERDAWLHGFRGWRRVLAPFAWRATGIPASLEVAALGPALFMSDILRARSARAHAFERTRVEYLGADRHAFGEHPAQPWSWRLLYAGRIDRRKGIDLALRVLPLLPDEARLTIAGGGDEGHMRELEDIARAEGVCERVRFTEVPREGLAAEYAAADVVLFPVRWLEPWGLVPLEAMTVGTPVVASGRGGSGEYLEDGVNCLIADPDAGPPAFADAISRLAADEDLRARVRAGGLRTSERLGEDAWYDAVEEILVESRS